MNESETNETSIDQESEIISPHPNADLFHQYLGSSQDIILKVVAKFRRSNHHLSVSEIVSDVNHSLLQKRDEILSKFRGDFTETNFNKLLGGFAFNCIRWKQCEISRSKYVSKRTNLQHTTDEGHKSTFDVALELTGCGEGFYENFDRNSKYSFLLKMVKEYSSIFTDKEVKVLSFLQKGLGHYDIADKLGVSHQAISLLSISAGEKIKAYLGRDSLKDAFYKEVSKGHKGIADFFAVNPNTAPMDEKDKSVLRKFLLDNARAYSSLKASQVFLDGKYSNRQIASFASKNKLSFCLLRKHTGYKFSEEETVKILSLLKKGKSTKAVSSVMGIPLPSIQGKKGSLVKAGLLEKS